MQITVTFDTADLTDNKILSVMLANLEKLANDEPPVANDTKSRARRVKIQTQKPEPVQAEVVEEEPANDDQLVLDLGDEPQPQPQLDASEPATYTLDDIRDALQTYTAAKGVPAGVELLKKYGAVRSSELAEQHYASFIKECAS